MSRPRRVLAYARVSSVEQATGTSLADQQASCAAYARGRGLNVTRFFVESESAGREKIERREQMRLLLAEVRAGDLVLVDKLDRWSRDPEFSYRTVRELLERGASMFFVAEGIDPSTRDGDTHLNFRILFAREEHKRIRERMVGTRELLRAKGYYTEGQTPFGYRRAKPKGTKGVEKNILVVEPEEAELVRRMFAMSLGGHSLTSICTTLGVARKRVWSSLHCRTYLGEVKTKTGWVKGLHEPIITPDIFTRANEAFRMRRYGGPRTRATPSQTDDWFLRDLARCARCGGKMTSAYGTYRPDGTRRYYYRCWTRCPEKGNRATNGSFVPVREVESRVSELVIEHLADLRAELALAKPVASEPVRDVVSLIAKLDKRRERHIEAHGEGLITTAELRDKLAKVDAERLRLAAEAVPAPLSSPQERRDALREVETLKRAWKRATPALRRQMAAVMMTACMMASGTEPEPRWRPAADLLVDR